MISRFAVCIVAGIFAAPLYAESVSDLPVLPDISLKCDLSYDDTRDTPTTGTCVNEFVQVEFQSDCAPDLIAFDATDGLEFLQSLVTGAVQGFVPGPGLFNGIKLAEVPVSKDRADTFLLPGKAMCQRAKISPSRREWINDDPPEPSNGMRPISFRHYADYDGRVPGYHCVSVDWLDYQTCETMEVFSLEIIDSPRQMLDAEEFRALLSTYLILR